MGHANVATMDSIYAHLYPSDYNDRIAKFERYVANAKRTVFALRVSASLLDLRPLGDRLHATARLQQVFILRVLEHGQSAKHPLLRFGLQKHLEPFAGSSDRCVQVGVTSLSAAELTERERTAHAQRGLQTGRGIAAGLP